jgi:nucleoside 2-deoxyribosyltransferase
VLPNDHPLKLDHEDLRENADAIFADLREVIKSTGVIVADLESFRGTDPDGGTLFEMGMTFAGGGLLYGFTRDKRPIAARNPYIHFDENHILRGRDNQRHRYADMPFAPSVTASAMLVEGDFHDCIKVVMADLDERRKRDYRRVRAGAAMKTTRAASVLSPGGKTAFLSSPARYRDDGEAVYRRMKDICGVYGIDAVSPLDGTEDLFSGEADPLIRACRLLDHWQEQLARCDIFLADLGDYNGEEPCGDTAFEAGAAWRLGKECYGYMEEAARMLDRIPNAGGLDAAGNVVENFDYPINLMFSSSMPILHGPFEDAVKTIAG